MELNIYCLGLLVETENMKQVLEGYIKPQENDNHIESDGLKKVSESCYKQYFVKKSIWSKYDEIESMLAPFLTDESETEDDFIIETPSALVFLKVEDYWYVLTFGHGRFYLETERVKKGWGISIVLNLYKRGHGLPSTVKSHQLDLFKKHEKTDIQNGASLEAFGIESYRAIIDGMNLKISSENLNFSGLVSGLDNIQLKAKSDNITEIIEQVESYYDEKLTINIFNNIEKITDEEKLLNHNTYINSQRNEFIEYLQVNIPSKLLHKDWYSPNNLAIRRKSQRGNDVDNASFEDVKNKISSLLNYSLDVTNEDINLDIREILSNWVIRATNFEKTKKEDIPLYNCITYSYRQNGTEYVLDEGELYRFKNNLIEQVNIEINRMVNQDIAINLPKIRKGWLEDTYNQHLASLSNNHYLLDKKNVQLTGYSKFEIADVIIKEGGEYYLVHNKGTYKNCAGSSCVSHLARQVEGSLHFLVNNPEEEIALKINGILEQQGIDPIDFRKKVMNRDIKLIAGIVNTNNDITKLPDFSKVTLAELNKKVASYGFDFIPLSIDRA